MKSMFASIALPLALSAAAFAQAAPAAAPAPAAAGPARIGIINIQQAIVASNEGQRDFGALEKKFEPKQNELQAAGKEVEDLKKQLDTQGPKLNDDARANLVKQIESRQKSLQRSFEDAQADLQAQQNDIANRIGRKLIEVLDKYARDNGYQVILDVSSPQSPVIWAGATTDLTKPIVDAYNAKSGVPAPAQPAGASAAPAASRPGAPAASSSRPAAPSATKPASTATTPK